MIDPKFILLAAAFNLWGSLSYVYSTIKGKTKPNRVTWFILALAPMIAFSAEIGSGVKWESLMTFMVGFGPFMIFISSFVNPKSYWKITRFDILCGAISIIALIAWLVVGKGNVAIILSIVADFLAFIPTLVKSYDYPETENSRLFRNAAISATITLLTIQTWKFANYAFPIYILVTCIFTFSLIRFKLGPKFKTRHNPAKT